MSSAPGIYLQALPIELSLGYAERAEASGFGSVWLSEITFGDVVTPAAAVAARTERIGIGTGIVGLWSRTPATTALTAASLQQLSQGRLMLGLGLQSRSYVESWHGQSYGKPLGAMREYLTILRQALDGETVTLEGDYFSIRGFHLDLPPPEKRIPLYVAAIGPKMLQLAGELADGVIGYVYSEEYVRNVVVPNLELGAARAGRSLEGFDIAGGFPSVVTEDDAGVELARGQAMMFATATKSAPAYAESIAQAGFGAERDRVAELVAAGELEAAVAAVPAAMADAVTISGTPDHARARIAAYHDAGLTTVVLNPSPPGGYFPLYEGHFPADAALPDFDFPGYLSVIERTLETMGSAV
ncbi:MAG: LLM class flavin-dependent oxidoreductase [Gaiellaceae bacterium]